MTVKVIIFDFDGTIADTFDTIVRIANQLATQFGYKQTSPEEVAQFQGLSSQKIIKLSGVSIFKLPFLIRRVRAELNQEISGISAFPGIKVTLVELKQRGIKLGIISSNSKTNIIAFLELNGLQNVFDFIYTGAKLFGKSKMINRLLKQENIEAKAAIYVGDETRDIEAAVSSQVKAIAVGWGFNSPEVLAAQNPDFLIQYPQELIDIVNNLQQVEMTK